ncbi:MAG: SNF2-related protein, partial [Pseudomonadota bacterium]
MSTANLPSEVSESFNPFGEDELLRACSIEFDESTLAKGRDYADQNRVTNLLFDGSRTVTATVAGSADQPYELRVMVTRGRENLSLRGTCSCPVRLNCKHVAATIFSWLNADKTIDSSDDAIALWREALKNHSEQEDLSLTADAVVVLYRIRQVMHRQQVHFEVAAYSARKLRSGGLGKSSPLALDRRHFDATDLSSHDARICNALIGLKDSPGGLNLSGEHGYMVFRWMVETGSCYYEAFDRQPLSFGPNLPVSASWTTVGNDYRQLEINLVGSSEKFVTLPTDPPWYVQPSTAKCGVIETDVPPKFLAGIAQLPAIAKEDALRVSELMVESIESVDLPLPADLDIRQISGVDPRGVVILSASKDATGTHRYAEILVDYDGARLPHMMALSDQKEFLHRQDNGQFVRVIRIADRELALMNELTRSGLPEWVNRLHVNGAIHLTVDAKTSKDMVLWQDLIDGKLADLKRDGWIIERTPEFEFKIVTSREWQMNVDYSAENRWFDLDLSFIIDGQSIALIPVLAGFLERVGPELPRYLDDPEACATVWLDEETLIEFPIKHIRPVLEVLVEMHEHDDGKLRFSDLQATVISDIAEGIEAAGEVDLEWDVPGRLAELLDKLKSFKGIETVEVPKSLTAELRDYQREGLSWLQFLREFELGGILADDMGLGKTVQALATVLAEKEAGRSSGPSLVVAP